MNVFKRAFSQIPTSICGLALGIASLGWCWEYVIFSDGNSQLLSAIVAGTILVAVVFKFSLVPGQLKQDLNHPVIGSILPTFTMALMIISNSIGQLNSLLGDVVWLIALQLHVLLLVGFVYCRIGSFALHHLLPSWFVPPVGMIVAAVSFSGNHSLVAIADGALLFGMTTFAVLLPLMIYRFIFCDKINDDVKPTIAVLAAPASLCLAGYLSVTALPSPIIVAVLGGVALLMTLVIYVALIHLLRLPFSPYCAAFTFPLVIGATALFKVANWLGSTGVNLYYIAQVTNIAYLELFVATLMVIYVSYRYFCYLALRPLTLKIIWR